MKKVKVEYEIEVPDNFEVGNCNICPFNHTVWYEDGDGNMDSYDYCIIDGNCEDKLKIIG